MTLAERNICSGCAACHDACQKSAISMVADNEGFFYPKIDESKCIRCGLCERVCPSLNRDLPRTPLAVYAAKAKDDGLRLTSSSGGVFSLLARQVIARGGVVYGAGFDHVDWHVIHKSAENENELEDLRGSKYVQSDVQGIYASVKDQLLAGREVLFSGTPCQVAGLRHCLDVLRVDVSKLLLVDVVCHAVPSPMVWQKYLDEREAALAGGRGSAPTEGRNIRRIAFRRKDCGWKRFSLSLHFANDREYRAVFSEDPFMRAFLAELCNRPSCHNCRFRELRSGADLTIGDFWGVERFRPEMDDDRGTSLVLVNTDKGALAFSSINPDVDSVSVTCEEAVSGNSALVRSPRPHRNRERFLRRCAAAGFERLVIQMLRPSLASLARPVVGRILRKLGLRK